MGRDGGGGVRFGGEAVQERDGDVEGGDRIRRRGRGRCEAQGVVSEGHSLLGSNDLSVLLSSLSEDLVVVSLFFLRVF